MDRTCEACRAPITGRVTKRFCSTTCRVRVSKGSVVPIRSQPGTPSVEEPATSALESAVRVELVDVSREGSALGVAALLLARRIDSGQESGTGLKALHAELRATMADARQGAVRSAVGSLRDELAARRAGA